MTEQRKYFDLEIGDVIKFYVGIDECHYPFTFTLEECVEEYCEMRGMDFVRVIEGRDFRERWRGGEFWYERHESDWTDTFGNIANIQQAVTRIGPLMSEVSSVMYRVQSCMREGFSDWFGDEE